MPFIICSLMPIFARQYCAAHGASSGRQNQETDMRRTLKFMTLRANLIISHEQIFFTACGALTGGTGGRGGSKEVGGRRQVFKQERTRWMRPKPGHPPARGAPDTAGSTAARRWMRCHSRPGGVGTARVCVCARKMDIFPFFLAQEFCAVSDTLSARARGSDEIKHNVYLAC